MNLDTATRARLSKFCKEAVDSWLTSASTHHKNLRRWNDLLEGVVEEQDFPWEGASNLHVDLVAIHVVTLHSVMARSILAVDPLWYAKPEPGTEKIGQEKATEIEQAMNYKAKSELNLVEATRDVLYTTPRDGTGWIQSVWAEETTPIETVMRVSSVAEFQAEFPTPESAGSTEEQYQQDLAAIQANASSETPYPVQVSFDRVDYKGPKFYVVDESDMVRAPMTAPTLTQCRVYGKRFSRRMEDLRDDATKDMLWSDAVQTFATKGKSGETTDPWKRARERIEGISGDERSFSDEKELFCLVVKFKLEDDGPESKLLVTYSHEKAMALGGCKYPYLKDCFTPFRIIRRPGRMLGVSIPGRLEQLNNEVDASINYEINSSVIEMAPIFKAKKPGDETFDPQAEENRVRPGVVWWMDHPDQFSQLPIQASDKSASSGRRQELVRYAEMLIGPTQLLSGRESPQDPNAPGNKTIALIQQSNMRIEDYINEFRQGFDELGDILVSLYYQFGDGMLSYADKQGASQTLARDILAGLPKMSTHGVTANLSPEIEFAKAMQWFQLLMPVPEISGSPTRRRELLSRLMMAGRLPDKDSLLPTVQEVQAAETAKQAPPPPQPPEPPKVSISFKADLTPQQAMEFATTGKAPPIPPMGGLPPAPGGSTAGPSSFPPAPPLMLPPINNLPGPKTLVPAANGA